MTSYPTATWCLLPATVRMRACVCVRVPRSFFNQRCQRRLPTSLVLLSFAAPFALQFCPYVLP